MKRTPPNNAPDYSEDVELIIAGRGFTDDDRSQLLLHIRNIPNTRCKEDINEGAITASICSLTCPLDILSDAVRCVRQEAKSICKKRGSVWIDVCGWTVRLDKSAQRIVEDIQAILDLTRNAESSIRDWHQRCRKRSEKNMKSLGTHMLRV